MAHWLGFYIMAYHDKHLISLITWFQSKSHTFKSINNILRPKIDGTRSWAVCMRGTYMYKCHIWQKFLKGVVWHSYNLHLICHVKTFEYAHFMLALFSSKNGLHSNYLRKSNQNSRWNYMNNSKHCECTDLHLPCDSVSQSLTSATLLQSHQVHGTVTQMSDWTVKENKHIYNNVFYWSIYYYNWTQKR